MEYIIEAIEEGHAILRYSDGSWAKIGLNADLKPKELDHLALQYAPKENETPSFLKVGDKRIAQEYTDDSIEAEDNVPEWYKNRLEAYGQIRSQIEYITENGLESWQDQVAQIKAAFPKED